MATEQPASVGIVTGANAGIGRATAAELSDRGHYVLGMDINESPHDEGPHFNEVVSTGELLVGDVSDPDNVDRLVATGEATGVISTVVNNAGIGTEGRIENVSIEGWDRCLSVHAKGTYHVCKRVLPQMADRGQGSIVNVSSTTAIDGQPATAEYTAAKGAITALTRQLAVDYSPSGVRINAVAPGFIKTDMNRAVWDERAEIADGMDYESVTKETLLPRLGEPEDVASAIGFLTSDEASFITGQIIPIDGGWTSW